MMDKILSMSNKLWNTPPKNMKIHSTPKTSVSQPPLDYNFYDMKKTQENISLFELVKI